MAVAAVAVGVEEVGEFEVVGLAELEPGQRAEQVVLAVVVAVAVVAAKIPPFGRLWTGFVVEFEIETVGVVAVAAFVGVGQRCGDAEPLNQTHLAVVGTVVAVARAVAVVAAVTPILVGAEPQFRVFPVRLAVVAAPVPSVGLTEKAF
ncbi:hypothetical protein HDU79_012033 [Rhizoclosmatium sp. JEL0117]|nr:hypothetical protein HDU79_012033 [Rhizoclosmatium sp. JEL0117]